jgi:RNA-directed DNA polymerase
MFSFKDNMPQAKYATYSIRKKNGKKRIITSPNKYLKYCQYEMLDYLSTIKVSDYAHGFVENRSIYTNAINHTNKTYVLNIDLKDFFPSINREMVSVLFQEIKIPEKYLDVVLLNNRLPQGSPCSPVISNLICRDMDKDMSDLAEELNLSYSRYADDMTFSGDNINRDIINKIYKIVRKHKLIVNKEKTTVLGRHKRQIVTGLVVNERVNIPKETRKRLRAMRHQYETLTEEEKEFLAGWNGIEQMIK